MTDHFVEVPKKVLSPTAQKVGDAAFIAYEDETLYFATGEQHAGKIAAAAIRALADQVVPEGGAFLSPGTAAEIRADILAIATELESQ